MRKIFFPTSNQSNYDINYLLLGPGPTPEKTRANVGHSRGPSDEKRLSSYERQNKDFLSAFFF